MKQLLVGGSPRSGTGVMCNLLTKDGRAIITEEMGLSAWKPLYEGLMPEQKERIIYVGDKQPQMFLANWKRFPDAKFIFTIRSGWGVISSYARRVLRKKTINEVSDEHVIKQTKFGQDTWMTAMNQLEGVKRNMESDRYIIVPYEKACEDVDGLMCQLGNFLGYDTPVNNGMNAKGRKWFRPTHLKWKRDIEPWVSIIESEVSDDFRKSVKEYEERYIHG